MPSSTRAVRQSQASLASCSRRTLFSKSQDAAVAWRCAATAVASCLPAQRHSVTWCCSIVFRGGTANGPRETFTSSITAVPCGRTARGATRPATPGAAAPTTLQSKAKGSASVPVRRSHLPCCWGAPFSQRTRVRPHLAGVRAPGAASKDLPFSHAGALGHLCQELLHGDSLLTTQSLRHICVQQCSLWTTTQNLQQSMPKRKELACLTAAVCHQEAAGLTQRGARDP